MSEGKPTAKKASGCEWYYPAVSTAYEPKPLIHGEMQETRYKAVKEAKRIMKEAQIDKPPGTD